MEVNQLLDRISDGDSEAYNELYPLVYKRLKNVAQSQLNKEYSAHTLCRTELVHEFYEKMVGENSVDYRNTGHFYSIAARSMRQILVDYARKKKAIKWGGQLSRLDINLQNLSSDVHSENILALNELLTDLNELDERLCTVVELRFFVGLSIEETAKILNISTATVNRDWLKARVWLYQQFNKEI